MIWVGRSSKNNVMGYGIVSTVSNSGFSRLRRLRESIMANSMAYSSRSNYSVSAMFRADTSADEARRRDPESRRIVTRMVIVFFSRLLRPGYPHRQFEYCHPRCGSAHPSCMGREGEIVRLGLVSLFLAGVQFKNLMAPNADTIR